MGKSAKHEEKPEEYYMRFINKWIEAKKLRETTPWVATELGISRDEVRGAAMYLRNRGILLPSLKNTVALDTASVNAYILSQLGTK